MRRITDISYGSYKENLLNLYLPENDSFDLFVYIHGGGMESGSKDNDICIFEYLTERGIAAASVEYRMYPNAKYPDFIEDAAVAAAWIKKNISSYGKCKRIFLGGSSAGGYLSMMLCFDESWLSKHGLNVMDFDGFVHDAGQPTAHFNVLREKNIDTRRVIVDETAPLYHIGKAPEYPPMYFIVSDNDLQNRYEQTQLLLSTLKHFGYDKDKIKYDFVHGNHCFYVGATDENGESIFGKMIYNFMKEY